MALFHS